MSVSLRIGFTSVLLALFLLPIGLHCCDQPLAWAADAQAEPEIRVAIALCQPLIDVALEGGGNLVALGGDSTIPVSKDGAITFSAGDAGVLAKVKGGKPLESKAFLITQGADTCAMVRGLRYRGDLEVSLDGDGTIRLVNIIAVEDYLKSVLPAEVPAGWPVEVLKAQTVASRTYAYASFLDQASEREIPGSFDVLATGDSQVYQGASRETSRTSAVVESTRGEICTYGGMPIRAVFHASSGGHTEDSKNVWNWEFPYLKGVPDFDQDSPHYTWEATLPVEQIKEALQRAGIDTGKIYSVGEGARGVSGRFSEVVVQGDRGLKGIKASDFRFALGLKSTLFEAEPLNLSLQPLTRKYSEDETVNVLGRGGTVKKLYLGSISTAQTMARTESRFTTGPRSMEKKAGREITAIGRVALVPESICFKGHGWGHGVGMSQWGAKALAEKGWSYREILSYYYKDIQIEKRW